MKSTTNAETNPKFSEAKFKAHELTDHIKDLADSYYKLGVIHVIDKGTVMASITMALMISSVLIIFVFIFLGFGLAWWLGEKLNSIFTGYAIVAGLFTVMIILVLGFRKQLLLPMIRNIVIRKVYE